MNKNNISYDRALSIIKEGDVLLFQGSGIASKLIQRAGEGKYSHVGIASWSNGILECVEFREGSAIASLYNKNSSGGGRSVSLFNEVNKYPGKIDVYRPVEYFGSYVFNPSTHKVTYERIPFEPLKVTQTMRMMTGLPYGWKRIIWIAKQKLAGFRLFYDMDSLVDDTLKDVVYPVCSTALAYSFSKYHFDIVSNKSDEYTEPNDFARSGRLSYLITVTP